MAKHRSRKRKKNAARRSSVPSKRTSVSPDKGTGDKKVTSSEAAADAKDVEAKANSERVERKPASAKESSSGGASAEGSEQASESRKSESKLEEAIASAAERLSDAGPDPSEKEEDRNSSSGKQDTSDEPKGETKEHPDSTQEQERSSDPGKKTEAADSSNKASSAKGKKKSKRGKGDKGQDAERKQSASDDEGFHDDFFLQGEHVEAKHMAEHEKLAKGMRPSEPELNVDHRSLRIMAPEVVARRKKMRRYVAYGLAPLVVIAGLAVAKIVQHSSNASSATSTGQLASSQPTQEFAAVSSTVPATPSATQSETTPDAGLPDAQLDVQQDVQVDAAADVAVDGMVDAAVQATDSGLDAGVVDAQPDVAPDVAEVPDAGEPDEGVGQQAEAVPEGVNARKEALKALNRAKWKDALRFSRAALAKDPTDATLYLYLGTALQESGQVKEARKVYSTCVHKATKGPKAECRAMGGK